MSGIGTVVCRLRGADCARAGAGTPQGLHRSGLRRSSRCSTSPTNRCSTTGSSNPALSTKHGPELQIWQLSLRSFRRSAILWNPPRAPARDGTRAMTTHHRAHRGASLILAIGVAILSLRLEAATLPAGFTETTVASGLASPTAMAFAPDGRLFVCQQGGQLRVIKNGVLRDPVRDAHRRLGRRTRAAGRRLRPGLRVEPLRLRLLHGHDADDSQPRQPVHGQRRRRRRRQRD